MREATASDDPKVSVGGIDCAQSGFDPATSDSIGGGISANIQHEPSLQIGFSQR